MKDLQQKIAYLQGQADGMELAAASKEGKIIATMMELLEELAEEVADLREQHEDLEDYVESIDTDLSQIEDDFYEDEDFDDEDMVEVECPNCHEKVCFEASILDEEDPIEVTCPVCDAVVYSNDEDEDYIDCTVDDDEEESDE